jgi:hypothetical protein
MHEKARLLGPANGLSDGRGGHAVLDQALARLRDRVLDRALSKIRFLRGTEIVERLHPAATVAI